MSWSRGSECDTFARLCAIGPLAAVRLVCDELDVTRAEVRAVYACGTALGRACNSDRLDVAEWLVYTFDLESADALEALFDACAGHRLRTAEWICSMFDVQNYWDEYGEELLCGACHDGYRDTVEWLQGRGIGDDAALGGMCAAVYSINTDDDRTDNALAIAELLRSAHGITSGDRAFAAACRSGSAKTMQWVQSSLVVGDKYAAVDIAGSYDRIDAIIWLLDTAFTPAEFSAGYCAVLASPACPDTLDAVYRAFEHRGHKIEPPDCEPQRSIFETVRNRVAVSYIKAAFREDAA